jgi:dihydrofolate reductase
MRKLKLQVQMSVDGFVARPNGELDWMTWNLDDKLIKYIRDLHESVDNIILGRKMTEGFVNYWESVKPDSPEFSFAKIMVNTPKIIFTKTLDKPIGKNTSLAKGNLTDEISNLKKRDGKDIIVYGGAGFVSSLIKHNLIDEYHLFINPTAIGNGLEIFKEVDSKLSLKLIESTAFDCGIVVNQYKPE